MWWAVQADRDVIMAVIGWLFFRWQMQKLVKVKVMLEKAVVHNIKESVCWIADGEFYRRADEGVALASLTMWEILILNVNVGMLDSPKHSPWLPEYYKAREFVHLSCNKRKLQPCFILFQVVYS